MQRSLLSCVRNGRGLTQLAGGVSPLSVRHHLPCVQHLHTSPVQSMPRYGGGSHNAGGKIRFSCPKCKSLIMFYCKFSGTKRHIRCHKCDELISVVHNPVPETEIADSDVPHLDNLYNSELLEELSRAQDIKSLDDKRLGRLFGPAYEEPSPADQKEKVVVDQAPPPRDIFTYLDKFVQGQDRAKKVLAVSIYNHYKRLRAQQTDKDREDVPRLDKSNVLLIGPTGSGKTYLFQMAAKLLDVPMVVCDCTSLTQAGYVGEDVESVIVRLWQAAGQDLERTQQGIIVLDELDKLASKRNKHGGKDIGGEGVQQSLLKIIEGTNVTVTDKSKNKTYQIDTRNILFLASGAFIGLDQIIKRRTASKSLGFGTPMSEEHHIKAASIEEKILETESLSETRKDRIKQIKDTEEKNTTKDRLLVQVEPRDILDYGVIPELAGRIPVVVTLDSLTQEDLMIIANDKERGVISQLKELLSLNDCELEFSEDALRAVAELAFCKKTGARALKSIVETTLLDAMFEIPGSDIQHVLITSDTVLEGKEAAYTRRESDITAES
ncbi:hypothetical protein ACHWQZ_G017318 [Mnemiopsis leidyi]